MRRAFVSELVALADRDPSVVLLTGDLGYSVLEPFADRFPDRFFNMGVAEQNMLGVATGLAASGFTPFAYSIATFASMRGYEFFRNGAVLHELPVRLVGVGGGVDYGHNGPTHYALEDVGLMRIQPGLTVIAPADVRQTEAAMREIAAVPGPVYLRLGKETTDLAGLGGRFGLGRAATIGEGTDLAIITYGSIAGEAIVAKELLEAEGIHARVVVTACLAPAPVDDLVSALGAVPLAVTLEAHFQHGGIGSLVSEVVAEHGLGCRVLRRAITSMPRGSSGEPAYLYDCYGLSGRRVADAVLTAIAVAH
jgi:transketolase